MNLLHKFFSEYKIEERIDYRDHLYASEFEKCGRQIWYSFKKTPPSNPMGLTNEVIFMTGKAVEVEFVKKLAKAGILAPKEKVLTELAGKVTWQGDKNQWHVSHKGIITGCPDAILADLAPLEVKSFYGPYYGKELAADTPKLNYAKQLAMYMYELGSNSGHMVHLDRGSGEIYYHEMTRSGTRFTVGTVSFDLSEDIRKATELLGELKAGKEIAKQYHYKYPFEHLSREASAGKLKKLKVGKAIKGEAVLGDWQCKYCSHKNTCQGENVGYSDEEIAQLKKIYSIAK